MAKILVVGLNPAWQTTLEFDALAMGEVNRAKTTASLASGKGINTAKVLRRMGHEVWLLQILGGGNGELCLEGCETFGIRSLVAWVDEETRSCITLLDAKTGTATEVIEPFAVGKPDLDRELLAKLPSDPQAYDALVLCGTVPQGVSGDIYQTIIARFKPKVKVVDAWQGLDAESLLNTTCVKMNALELAALKERVGGAFAKSDRPLFAITAGAGEAYMVQGGQTLAYFTPPRLSGPVNPIGAGDTVTAGLVHHLLLGLETPESFRRALAMGSASCIDRVPAEFSDEDFQRLLPMVTMRHA